MVNKCCVPACTGNYRTGKKTSVFKFPKDSELRKNWIHAIRRENFTPSEHSVVCQDHFVPSDLILQSTAVDWKTGATLTVPLDRPRLREGAVPSVLPNCPIYLSTRHDVQREAPCDRRQRLEAAALRKSLSHSLQTAAAVEEKFRVQDYDELVKKIDYITLSDQWSKIVKDDYVMFIYFDFDKTPHDVVYLTVCKNLSVKLYVNGRPVECVANKFCRKVNSINDIENILKECSDIVTARDSDLQISIIHSLLEAMPVEQGKKKVISFLKEQSKLCLQSKAHHTFEPEFFIFCSILFTISPHAYKFLRSSGIVIMPHPNSLRKLSGNLDLNPNNSNILRNLKDEISCLDHHERFVTLMVDEIHIKPNLDFKGGNIAGMTLDTGEIATSVHVFMIQSILCSFKKVVHILPVRTLNAESLFDVSRKLILGVESVGFKIISLVADNNSINRKSVTFFAKPPQLSFVYPSPVDTKQPLFFLHDTVHIFKCIRNNWINLKNDRNTFCYPDFDNPDIVRYASFSAVREIYEIENQKLVKYAYGLSVKALWPSSLERQNVKLVTQVFSEYVESSLIELGPLHNIQNWESTAKFINIIRTWWSVVNVKTPLKGIHHNDEMQKPLTNKAEDMRYNFLDKFITWIDNWKILKLQNGKLSQETHTALRLTTYGLMQITEYCCRELNMSYILPGKFQTDSLEARFGLYRRLSGCQYHISLRQLLESEKKLRLMSILELNMHPDWKLKILHMSNDDENPDGNVSHVSGLFPGICVTDEDLANTETDLPVLTYIAGFCCHTLLKKLQCLNCTDFLTLDKCMASDVQFSLISHLDRGRLKFPRSIPVLIVTYTYVLLQKLLLAASFMKLQNQRAVAAEFIFGTVIANDVLCENCCTQHTVEDISKKIIWTAVNIILNNYCKKKNNEIAMQPLKKVKKRKFDTLCHNLK